MYAFPVLLLIAPLIVHAQTWTDETFDDFERGQFDAGGQNLFVTHDGKVRTIHRFDLNDSGHIDLVFNNTHDTSTFHEATEAWIGPDGNLEHGDLAVRGSIAVEMADLNNNGFSDLVFCPNFSHIQNSRRFLTVIVGGPDGWPAHRAGGLLPVGARPKGVALGDVTGNGWKDIIALCDSEHPDHNEVLRVFKGSEDGFSRMRFEDIPVPGAIVMAGADFNRDGVFDLAVLTLDSKVIVVWGDPENEGGSEDRPRCVIDLPEGTLTLAAGDVNGDGRPDLAVGTNHGVVHLITGLDDPDRQQVRTVEADHASHLTIADLDGDGYPDLVATYLATAVALGGEAGEAAEAGHSVVFWGGRDGFSADRRTALDVDYPRATAAGDMTGDGHLDLAVAIYQSEETYAADSVVYLGRGDRRFERHPAGVPTTGAADAAIAPADDHRPARAVFANSLGGTVGERVPVQIYWGEEGGFDPENSSEIPFVSAYEATAADFNGNGYVDLMILNAGHGRQVHNPDEGANIFWGGPEGFSHDDKTVLSEEHLATSNVADLNRNGHLDIVLGSFQRSDPDANYLAIYYGSEDGYTIENRAIVPLDRRSVGTVVADFNKDDWLDIAVVCYNTHRVFILWGSDDGFSRERKQVLEVPGAIAIETADLNSSGHLDLIVGSYNDPVTMEHDTGIFIFWGSEEGFSPWNHQWLPGMTPLGFTVADFDNDGYLDLFSPHYHADGRREAIPSYLYWGGPDGFRYDNKTLLINDSADDSIAGDFNGNGLMDLAVANHARHGDHHTTSKVFYNDGNRFRDPEVTELPTRGTHWMYHQDTGHIYHRRWEQEYRSGTFEWTQPRAGGRLEYDAEIPGDSKIVFSVRSAVDSAGLEAAPWRRPDGGNFPLHEGDRVLQYRATFISDNGDRYPILERVKVSVE